MTIKLSELAANAATDVVTALADGGHVEIRTGAQPASTSDAATGTVLANITLADPAFAASAAGIALADVDPVLTATAITDGDATWYRLLTSGDAVIHDGVFTATGGGGDMTAATVTFTTGVDVEITSWSYATPVD